MQKELVNTDVLCVGGGIAGLMAAIRSAELGAKVIVAEKGNVEHSGRGRFGNDHFETYIPEVHGIDMEAWIDELMRTAKGETLLGRDIFRAQFSRAFDIVKLWQSWGIPMKYKGRWEFAGHSFPGRAMTHIKYRGALQKHVLVKQARDRGVEIMNRIMVFDLLRDGDAVVGAVGVHAREKKLIVFQAKAVLLATGKCSRLYPSLTPGLMFNDPHGGGLTGDGRAMAYRAGAQLQNVEMPERHIGPKYFTRFGQATWIGVLRNPEGEPAGTFLTKPDRKYSDMIMEVNKLVAEQHTKAGKGPVYMDCTGLSEEDYEYMRLWMNNEGMTAMLDHMEEEGIDFSRHPIEFATYPIRLGGQIAANARAETSMKGLYAAGDEAYGDISAAATFGWIGGENAAGHVREGKTRKATDTMETIDQWEELLARLYSRRDGPDWEEANVALQQVMNDYAGAVRNENLLEQGLSHLRRLKDKVHHTMVAGNPHELMRCLEVINMFDIGEIVFLMALDRKETRGLHNRPDYPFTNPLLNQFHVVNLVAGKPVIGWKEISR